MIALIAFAALQAAVPASSVPMSPSAAPVAAIPATPVQPKEKMVCQEEDTTGTRLGAHKVCMTKSQWREAYEQQRDAVRHSQNNLGYVHQ